MTSIVQNLAIMIPVITFIGSITFLIIKVFNRTKIEMLLEDKFKKKLYSLIEILILSVVMSFSITAASSQKINLSDTHIDILASIFMIATLLFLIALLFLGIQYGIYQLNVNKRPVTQSQIKKIKWNSVILFLLLIAMQISSNLIAVQSSSWEEIILSNLIFTFLYFSLLCFITYINDQSIRNNPDFYQVKIIREEINQKLSDLFFLYALGKEKLVFIERKDAHEMDVNNLSKFYIYNVNHDFLMKFELYQLMSEE